MLTQRQRQQHEQWLVELTGLPTAAGREDRVVRWVTAWAESRRDLVLRTDRAGNLLIRLRRRSSTRPLLITAHLDHPAFVVRSVLDRHSLELEFRGGVHDPYFRDAAVELFDANDQRHRAIIADLDSAAEPFKRVTVRLGRPTDALAAGDVGRWSFKGRGTAPVIRNGTLWAPACDDLAGVAAALSSLDVLRRRRGASHVGVLLTRAEEVGFIGAIAACKGRTVPKHARLICLETSRSFPDSPLGDGPVVRVGDRMSVFSPDLTNRIASLLLEHQQRDRAFRFQRKLMPGGTCEATTFSSYGFESTCICLPLGNYHNMVDIDGVLAGARPALVGPEHISVDDYHGMIELLVLCGQRLDDRAADPLRARMESLWAKHGDIVQRKVGSSKRK